MRPQVIVVGCCLMLGTIKPAASQEKRALLLEVGRMVQGGREITAEVWPNFEIPTMGIICAEDGLTVIVSPELTYEGRTSAEGLEEVSRGQYLLPEPPRGLDPVCFDLAYPIGGERLVAVPLIREVYSVSDPVLANLAQLYHEAFHRFQEEEFSNTARSEYLPLQEVRIPLALINSPGFGTLAQQERALLVDALQESDPVRKRSILEQYVGLRRERTELLPRHLREAEAHQERKEGTANLVGLEVAFAVAGLPASAVRRTVANDLRSTPKFAGQNYLDNAYRQWHIYATGSAIGLLLQDLQVKWRERVQGGWTPYGLLLEKLMGRGEAAGHGG